MTETPHGEILSARELLAAMEDISARNMEKTVERTVELIFLRLGVDPQDNGGVARLKDNLNYLNQKRKDETAARALIKTSAATLLTGLGATAIMWFLVVVKGGLHDAFVEWLAK